MKIIKNCQISAQISQKELRSSKKPTVNLGCTPENWSYFEARWDDYKQLANIKETNIIANLMECCDDALRKDIFHIYGNLKIGHTEQEALKKNFKNMLYTWRIL